MDKERMVILEYRFIQYQTSKMVRCSISTKKVCYTYIILEIRLI